MDYKELDTQNIVRYLQLFSGGVNVDNILQYSGADKLRVYPAAPRIVRWIQTDEHGNNEK